MYCDALHVVVAQYVQLKQSHIASFIGHIADFIALELSFEKLLEANANKLLVQGLPDLCDAQVAQAADELVFGDARGGKRTYQRVVDRVRFGPRDHAIFFLDQTFQMRGSSLGPLDFDRNDTPNLPLAAAEPECDPAADLDEAKRVSGQKGYYDESTLEWLFEPHAYQVGPDADPHMSFWECQKGDEYEYEDSEDEMDEMDGDEEEDEGEDEDGEVEDGEDDENDEGSDEVGSCEDWLGVD
jgi:hypothetical protein